MRFIAVNGSMVCSISTIGKQLECKDSIFALYAMNPLLGHAMTCRIVVGPPQGCKAFTLIILPTGDPEEQWGEVMGKVAGFSQHTGVSVKAQ